MVAGQDCRLVSKRLAGAGRGPPTQVYWPLLLPRWCGSAGVGAWPGMVHGVRRIVCACVYLCVRRSSHLRLCWVSHSGSQVPCCTAETSSRGSLIQANGGKRDGRWQRLLLLLLPPLLPGTIPPATPSSCGLMPHAAGGSATTSHCPMYADMCGPLFAVWRPPGGLPGYCTVAGPVSLVCCSCRVAVLSQGEGGHTL
jgi:hypothetical protein